MQSNFFLSIEAIERSVKLKVTPEDVSLRSKTPLPSEFPELLTAPPVGIFQHAFHRGGVDFFWNNPLIVI